jgi:hypothetical protein
VRFEWVRLVGALVLLSATGCSSAKIKDVYLSLDSQGHRISTCIRPTKLDGTSGNHYWVFVELASFRDDTLLTPLLFGDVCPWGKPSGGICTFDGTGELQEFGNIAPGKGDVTISWEMRGPKLPPPNDTQNGPLPVGHFDWQFYVDDHSTPDEHIKHTISPDCP